MHTVRVIAHSVKAGGLGGEGHGVCVCLKRETSHVLDRPPSFVMCAGGPAPQTEDIAQLIVLCCMRHMCYRVSLNAIVNWPNTVHREVAARFCNARCYTEMSRMVTYR